jgi:hypothetical protein
VAHPLELFSWHIPSHVCRRLRLPASYLEGRIIDFPVPTWHSIFRPTGKIVLDDSLVHIRARALELGLTVPRVPPHFLLLFGLENVELRIT